MANSFSPALNLPSYHKKGLIKLFGGLAVPFYFTDVVVSEGQPMKPVAATQDKMTSLVGGDGASCFGLAMQATYDESAFAKELKGYHFANSTKQRLDGMPIGLLTGTGYALTNFYTGTVAWNDPVYVDPTTKKLIKTGVAGDLLPAVFESGGVGGATLVRIRFNFKLA
jgi:hypothetical protein